MDYLPLSFDLRRQRVLLAGGGGVALRKARWLVRAGARLRVVAPVVEAELEALLDGVEGAELLRREYREGDLEGVVLAVAATSDDAVNAEVARAARRDRIPVNAVDQPSLCTVIFPAIIDRSPVTVAISSGGSSPLLVRRLKARIDRELPARLGELAALLRRYRDAVGQRLTESSQRLRFWERAVDGDIADHALAGRLARAEALLQQALEQPVAASRGEVALVGAGPGDPELLTLKALRWMQNADVVLYDRLVSPEVLALVRQDAERIYVGKACSQHTVPQGEINALLVDLARRGMRVLRLKGGDPFIFGRGGEELEELAAAGLPFQVVPGITAASGCASYAGIPLTHRDHAHSVRLVSGHLREGSEPLPWAELAVPGQTLVVYMSLRGLPEICRQLIAHGRSPATPAALVERGTTRAQRVLAGSLADLPDRVAATEVKAPTLLIIGEVVALRERLSWFEAAGDEAGDNSF